MNRKSILSIVFLLSASSLQAQEAMEVERRAILQAGASFSAAYVRGDVNAMMECYSDSAVIMPPGRDMISHPDSIRKYWTLPPGHRVTRHESTPTEITIAGSTAYDYGYYEGAISREDSEAVVFRGKYVYVWVKGSDSRWRMKIDIWNSLPSDRRKN